MKIVIENLTDGDSILHQNILLIRGRLSDHREVGDIPEKGKEVIDEGGLKVLLEHKYGQALLDDDDDVDVAIQSQSVRNSRFKFLVRLRRGENKFVFRTMGFAVGSSSSYALSVFRETKAPPAKVVKLVYLVPADGEGEFQAPDGMGNGVEEAVPRIALAAELVQCFIGDSLACHEGLGRRTFALEAKEESHDSSEQQLLVGRPTVHVFKSKLTSAEAWSKSASELWDAHARELIESDLYSDDVKFLAVMSATRYAGAAPSDERPPRSHSELLSRVKGHAALGGGGLALFGSGCLYTWPGRLDQVQQRLRDRTEVDWRRFMDDSAYRHTWGACFSTSLGSVVHELGHCFGLVHTDAGVMARGFDDIDRYFTVADDNEERSSEPATILKSPKLTVVKIESKQNIRRFTKISQTNPGSELLGKYYHKQDYEQMRSSFGGCFFTRQCALLLFYHKWLNPASDRASPITATDSSIKSPDSDLAVVDARDVHRNSVGFVEPKAKEFSIADLRTAFPSAVEICAVNKTGEMSMTILAK